MRPSVPARGELWWADLDPVIGRERGRRPVLIVSRNEYNETPVGRVIVVAVTSRRRAFSTWVPINRDSGLNRASWALADQVRAIDVRRLDSRIGSVDAETLAAVQRVIRRILGM